MVRCLRGACGMKYLIASALVFGLAGCPAAEPTPPPAEPPPPEMTPAVPTHELQLPEGAEGATSWVEAAPPDEFDEDHRFESPQALVDELERLQAERDLNGAAPEVTSEIVEEDDDVALGRLVVAGVPDDSIYGDDYLIEMSHDGEGWYATQMWTRVLCHREVDRDVCI